MRYRIAAAVAIAAAAVLVAACNDSDPFPPPERVIPADDAPPTPALEISFSDLRVEGYTYVKFNANPLGSKDDYTARNDLAARWDWENDGVWDTSFRPLVYETGFVPRPLPTDTWSVKCEVRDGASHIVGVCDTIAMPRPWFRAPDIVARPACIDTIGDYSETDTVRVGQQFLVMANHLRWTEAGTTGSMSVEVWLDGVMVQQTRHPLAPNIHWGTDDASAAQYFSCVQTVADAGVHTVTVVVDTADELAETDETNNRATRTFVAVP